jgi:hypothetical protein
MSCLRVSAACGDAVEIMIRFFPVIDAPADGWSVSG